MKRSRIISFQKGRCRCGMPDGNKISKDIRMKCKHFLPVFLGAFLLLLGSVTYAQQERTISGVVSSSQQNVPLSGVSILVKGTNTGTFTTMSGSYHVNVPATAQTLVFSYVGYRTQEVPVTGNDLNVTLYPDSANTLGDVVVIGYGAVRKGDVSGSISTISAKDFQTGTITSFDQAIAGKAPGITITPNGGHPGSGSTIRIRGVSTINGSQDPLVVVDGVPFGGYVNPNDIESVTILKDAASAAIYGSLASGGVILITTKKGKPGEVKLNFNTQFSVGNVSRYVSVLNATQFKDYIDAHPTVPNFSDTAYTDLIGAGNTNWQKEIYQTALTSNSNLSILGSIGKALPYRLSVGFLDQNGVLRTDNMKRTTGSLSLTPSFFQNHLKVELNLNGSLTKNHNANQDAIGAAVAFDPTQSVYDPNNKLMGGYFQWMANDTTPNSNAAQNPVALLMQKHDQDEYNRGYGNLKLDYSFHFLPELHISANWGFDASSTNGTTKGDSTARSYYNIQGNTIYKGLDNQYKSGTTNVFAEYMLNYDKSISSIKSHINAMVGYDYYNWKSITNNYASYDYRGRELPNSAPLFPKSSDENALVSYMGRLIYTYDDKYILNASVRDDGSSKLDPSRRWLWYPAISLAWDMHKEDFLKNSNTISTLKIRLSYGVTANQGGISNYGYIPTYFSSNAQSEYQLGDTFYPMLTPSAYNATITWEHTNSSDAGVDFGFINDRISGSIDYYYKATNNLLINANIPLGTNFTNQIVQNVGAMTSKGVDFNLNLIPVQNKNSEWDVNLNASYNSSKITKLPSVNGVVTTIQTGGIAGAGLALYSQEQVVGQNPNAFYVYKQVYNAQGAPIEGAYEDLNGDGQITTSDLYLYQSPFPDWTFGFSTSYRYKKFTISTVLRSDVGNYMYNNVASNLGAASGMALNGTLSNVSANVLTTNFVTKQLQSDYYVQNASFLKMDNIGLSYDVGKVFKSDKTNLTISGNVQNVFTITKYTGLNPEIYGGIDNNFYPIPRVYTLGLNLNF